MREVLNNIILLYLEIHFNNSAQIIQKNNKMTKFRTPNYKGVKPDEV